MEACSDDMQKLGEQQQGEKHNKIELILGEHNEEECQFSLV